MLAVFIILIIVAAFCAAMVFHCNENGVPEGAIIYIFGAIALILLVAVIILAYNVSPKAVGL